MKFHYHIIINSNAQNGRGEKLGHHFLQLLSDQNLAFTSYFTKHPGDESTLAKNLLKKTLKPYDPSAKLFPLLIVLGGDGTLSHVVDALKIHPEIPIGYIPAGSGNDFSRAAGIFSKKIPQSFANFLTVTRPKSFPVLEVREGGKSFQAINSVGMGIDGAVIHQMGNGSLKKILNRFGLGDLSYFLTVLGMLRRLPDFTAEIQVDGAVQKMERCLLLTASNHQYFGGGIRLVPVAKLPDPDLYVVILKKSTGWRLAQVIWQALSGKHLSHPDVTLLKGQSVTIRLLDEGYGQCDGEPIGLKPFHLEISLKSRLFWIK